MWEGGEEGMCLLDFGKRLCFLPWNLDIKLLGNDAQLGEEEQVRGAGRAASSLVLMTHPPLHPHHSQVLCTPSPPLRGRKGARPGLLPHPLAQGMARRLAGRSPGLRDD